MANRDHTAEGDEITPAPRTLTLGTSMPSGGGHIINAHSMKNFADHLRKAGKPHKVIIAAVVRKLVIIADALRKKTVRKNIMIT